MKKLLVVSVAMVCGGWFAGEASAQNGDWALARRGGVVRTSAVQPVLTAGVPVEVTPVRQTQVVRYQTVDASGFPVETTVTSSPVYVDSQYVQGQPVQIQTAQTFRNQSNCCCQPIACQNAGYQGVQYVSAVNPSPTYAAAVSPAPAYGLMGGLTGGMTGAGRPVYVGRGILGQPKAFVQGQPLRNSLRWLLP